MPARALIAGAGLVVLGSALAAALSTRAVASTLLDWYAPRTLPVQTEDLRPARAIVLLGAGTDRVLEAARVYRLMDQPWVISSGGVLDRSGRSTRTSAALMRDDLVNLGVPESRILLEDRSLTTEDEARLVTPMLRALECTTFVLVTSRSHMPRAAAVFRSKGLDPILAVAPDLPPRAASRSPWRPSAEGLRVSRRLAHEVVGMAYYWLRGWIAPAPRDAVGPAAPARPDVISSLRQARSSRVPGVLFPH
jgi:uncharacterized SAM-binding protein YcdF (DUF218 family)